MNDIHESAIARDRADVDVNHREKKKFFLSTREGIYYLNKPMKSERWQ